MEHYVNLALKALFVENWRCRSSSACALPRHLEEGGDLARPRHRGGRGADHHRAGQQPDLQPPAQGRRARVGGPRGVDLSFLGLITYIGTVAAIVQILEMFSTATCRRCTTRSASSCR